MDPDDIDKDARDIVRKAGYLMKVANARPDYVVKYLMGKCDVLAIYNLIPEGLVTAAKEFGQLAYADPPVDMSRLKGPLDKLVATLERCAPAFRKPLAQSLAQHPLLVRDKTVKKLAKA
jgi:hypothetical protein